MSTATPVKMPPCDQCGNTVRRTEKDQAGIIIICTICGGCTYFDKKGREIGDAQIQELREIRNGERQFPSQRHSDLTSEDEYSNMQAQTQEKNQMRTTECSYCRFSHTRPPSRANALLTHCGACQKWSVTNPKPEYDRDDEVSAILYLYYRGMKAGETFQVAAEVTGKIERDSSTGLSLIRKHTVEAVRESQKYKPECGSEWMVLRSSFQNLSPLYYSWTITDSKTQYVLATQISEDPGLDLNLARAAIQIASMNPEIVIINKNVEGLEARITGEFQTEVRIEENLARVPGGAQMVKIHKAMTERHQQFTRNRKNLEAMNMNMAGIAVNHNFFEEQEDLNNLTPAGAAGLSPRYSSWSDVVRKKPETAQDSTKEEPEQPAGDPAAMECQTKENQETENPATENPESENPTVDARQDLKPHAVPEPTPDPTINQEQTGPADAAPESAPGPQEKEAPTSQGNGPDDPPANQPEAPEDGMTEIPTLTAENKGDHESQKEPEQEPAVNLNRNHTKDDTVRELQKLFNRLLERENRARLEYLKAEKERLSVATTIELIKHP